MDAQKPVNKRNLIRNHAGGLSYVDVGGLWGTHGETVTTALEAGASRAAMADIQSPGGIWWQRFEARCAELGFTDYDEIQVDICRADAPELLGRFDFVHCAGVMYHVADLFQFVSNLVSVTEKYLLLSSVVMPSRITGPSGTLEFGPDHAYLSPLLTPEHKQIVVEHLEANGMGADGLTQDVPYFRDRVQPKFGPWWWLYTSEFMERLVELYGLAVLVSGPTPKGKGYTVFAEVR